MDLNRRELLTASALLWASPKAALCAAVQSSTGTQPIVLCWNENPYGPSPAARAVISATIPGSCRYPDEEINQLTDSLAQTERVTTDHIVVGSGSGELLCALGLLHGRNGGEIIAAEPTYAELTNYAQHAGAQLKFVPVDTQLNHDLAAMRAAVSPRTRAIYVCNPNNPTGTAISAGSIRSFVGSLPDSVTTIVDEAYLDFADGADVAAEIAAVRMSSPNIFAMRAARASLGDQTFLADTRRRIVASRTLITDELTRLKLNYARPQTNFVFFDTGAPLEQFDRFMKARNILVGRLFPPYNNWCRITIGTEPEVAAFLQGLRAYTGRHAAAA